MRIHPLLICALFLSSCGGGGVLRAPASAAAWHLGDALPGSLSPLFREKAPANLALKGAFDRVHKANAGGNWTGEDRTDAGFWSEAELIDLSKPDRKFKAKLRARGMSSATDGESTFPKLRVEIADGEALKGTIFKDARNFRINTHVDTDPKRTHTDMRRLVGEAAPYREALGYDLASVLGLPAPGTRRARIAYEDSETKKKVTRQALLIESDKKVAERFGTKFEGGDFPEDGRGVETPLAARYHFFHVLIGNDDIGLRMKNEPSMGTETYRPLFNTTIFVGADGYIFPIIYDLDMSVLSSGFNKPIVAQEAVKELGVTDGEVGHFLARLGRLRARMSKREYDDELAFFISQRAELERVIKAADVDAAGKTLALSMVKSFFLAAEALKDIPMVMRDDVGFYAKADLKTSLLKQMPASETEGFLRAGTAVKVLESKGGVLKIAMLDSRYDLLDGKKRVGYVAKDKLVTGFDLLEAMQGQVDERDMTIY